MAQPLFALNARHIARIALPLPVDELFDYSVPEALEQSARPGCRVQVRVRERQLVGIIVERSQHSEFQGRLLPIDSVLDLEPALSSSMIELLREAARDLLCPVGIALATALPAGSTPRAIPGYAISERGRTALAAGAVTPPSRALLQALLDKPRSRSDLSKLEGANGFAELERDGLIVSAPLIIPPRARVTEERFARLAEGVDVEATISTILARSPQQAALLRQLAARGEATTTALREEFSGVTNLLRALEKRELIVIDKRRAPRNVLGRPLEEDRQFTLNSGQARCLEPIISAIQDSRHQSFLLHGVTGSGKTEIYLRAVGEALRAGRQALVMVPEITLTHQILARLRGRFGDELAILHSGLRPGERLEQWERLRAGFTPIAVGARSALFAPLDNLGVIVIDEEHDSAYKNDEGFRYHAKDLAMRRGQQAGCPVILGSATPSLETRFAADSGKIQRLVLAERIAGRPLPAVEIVDLAEERKHSSRGRKVILSASLLRGIEETLSGGAQTILFLNRRGFSTTILCFDCGAAEHCENCDITLVYHSADQKLLCHYCDFEVPPPAKCTSCGAPDTALLGVGTQQLEEEVRSRFPKARIARLDRDTARTRGYTEGVLRGLHERTIDIVIGTQMVAKGHDFPGVQLVGVVAADIGLHMPDFRAAERTFQLLTQVAGRAGRDTTPGRVIIQAYDPSHYSIAPVLEHDYEHFYEEEMGYRRALGYPPVGQLVRVLITGPDEKETQRASRELAQAVSSSTSGTTSGSKNELALLGPAPAPLARLRGRYRIQLLVKGPQGPLLREAAKALVKAAAGLPAPLQASVDVNPMSML